MLYKKEANSRDRKFNIEKGGGGSIVEIRKEICLKYLKMTKCLNTFVAHCSFELCSNKRTESRFRGIISILYCSKQRKMQIIPLNLDSVLLLLHNSKLAYLAEEFFGEISKPLTSKDLAYVTIRYAVSTKCRLQTADQVQNADCRLQIEYKMQADKKKLFFASETCQHSIL